MGVRSTAYLQEGYVSDRPVAEAMPAERVAFIRRTYGHLAGDRLLRAAAAAWQVVRSRGHGALLVDLRDVVPGTSMLPVRRFVLEGEGLRADQNAPEVLPYRRMQVLVHVAHSEVRQIIGHEMVYVGPREGVQRRETVTQEHDAHESLYIFRNDGGQPWIVRERDAHYAALGRLLQSNKPSAR